MSWQALAWAAKCHVNSASEKLMLLAYADRHNEETGCAYPSIAWLCEFSSLNRKTVISAVARIEAAGLLSDTGDRMGKTRQMKVYRLHLETVPEVEQSQKRNSSDISAKQSLNRDTEPVREPDTSGAKAPSVRARGCRIPENWKPEKPYPASIVELLARWPPGREQRELEGFVDYWSSRQRDAAKLDWDKTWWNRIRDQHDRVMREARNDGRTNGMGRHQPGDGLSSTTRAANRVWPDAPFGASDERAVSQ